MLIRGFKSWCENTSVQLRKDLGLRPCDPLKPQDVARRLNVLLLRPDQIPDLSTSACKVLLSEEKNNWSAVMVSANGRDAVVYNPTHSVARQTSDIMHEMAHIIRGHKPSTILLSHDSKIALRGYDKSQEDEAAWFAGCLLLPRTALVWIQTSRVPFPTACARYSVSHDLLKYRMQVTGVHLHATRLSGSR